MKEKKLQHRKSRTLMLQWDPENVTIGRQHLAKSDVFDVVIKQPVV